jgi:hypothetical protein
MPFCTTEGCQAPNGGTCLEGLPNTKCTHYSENEPPEKGQLLGKILPANDLGLDEDFTKKEEEKPIQLYSGLALTEKECNILMANSLSHFILLGGLSKSGKTTSLTSLFNLFQNGPFGEFLFAGSRTMAGFERRSHESRIASGRTSEDTARTIFSEDHEFLHLKVQQQIRDKKPVDLIFTDISGEFFSSLKNSTEECRKFKIGNRADHFALFLDSESLCDNHKRNIVRTSTIGVLRSLIEADAISKDTYVQIVFSRWDLAEQTATSDGLTKTFFESTEKEIKRKFPEMVITFHRVASRPMQGSQLTPGYGLTELLPLWAGYSKFEGRNNFKGESNPVGLDGDREYQKYLYTDAKVE